ncbi:MAG: hydrogenase maturation nickel metallochaperone HypA [Candidatus Krumholzibacteriia bacterium]
MHELPITEGILDLVLDHAARAGAARVTAVHLVIGELSGFVADSVRFCWDLVSEGTRAQGAVLQFRRVPLRLACRDCGGLFAPDGVSFDCPACGSGATGVAEGREFRVESIDIEDPVAGEGPA